MPPALQPPTEADLARAADASAGAAAQTVELATPTGPYSGARLATLSQALQACLDVLSPGSKLPTSYELPEGLPAGSPIPLPRPLVEAYLTARGAYQAYLEEQGEDSDPLQFPDPTSLTSDAELALLVQKLRRLVGQSDFRKWAKAQQMPEAAAPAKYPSAPTGPSMPSEIPPDLAAMLGR